MGIFLKLLFKNIIEKKMRSFLIIFSITMAAALFFASMSISDTMIKTFSDKIKKSFGEAEIKITANDNSPTKYFSSTITDSLKNEFDYTIGILENTALYKPSKEETFVFSLKGMDWEDINLLSPVTLLNNHNLIPFEGRKIIISKTNADKYGLSEGDTIELQIEENYYKFEIAAIADSGGLFTGATELAIIPKDLLGSIIAQKGSISTLYIKLKNPENKNQIISDLSLLIKRLEVAETITDNELHERTVMFTSILSLMLLIIIALSVFIIHVSFKVIVAERLPLLGTLRSVGANKISTDLILIGESIIYGILGGLLACAAGVGILYLLALSSAEGARISVVYTFLQFPITLSMAIALSVMSSLIPIISVSKLSIKDIVLNTVEIKEKHRKLWKLVLGIIIMVIPLIAPRLFSGDTVMLVIMVCIILAVAGTIMLIPYITASFIYIFERVYIVIFGNIGVLAIRNLRDNRNILNNISLLAIGISTVLMVNITGKSAVSGILNFTQHTLKYDLTFAVSNMDRSTESRITSIDGISEVCGFYIEEGVEVKGFQEKIETLEGISNNNFSDFKVISVYGGTETNAFEDLDKGRNIILGQLLSARYKAKVGDKITLILNKQPREYKVIALMDTMNHEGNYAIISDRYFRMDTGSSYYSSLGIKTNTDSSIVLQTLNNIYSRSAPSGETMHEFTKRILKESNDITSMMDGISVLTMLIGIFGVLNNLTISFIQRKRSISVFHSVGMSKLQTIIMVFIEAFSGGLIGGIIGSFTGWIIILMMPALTKALIATIPMKYSLDTFLYATAAGIIITLAASISTAMKFSRLNIIQSIKYD